jgi:hypothetical protein
MQRRSRIGVAAIALVTMATVATACGPNANTSIRTAGVLGPMGVHRRRGPDHHG